MAELVASIIGIVSAGTKVALVLSQLAADIGSAGHEARMMGGEIRSFCAVLKTLGETMEKIDKSPYYAHCSEMIKDMTAASLEMFTEILNATESLKSLTAGRDGKDGNFGIVTRVQWTVFKKPKLLILRAAIEAYKSNLSLMLGTISTAEKVARRNSSRDAPKNFAEDAQDRSLLASLELDRKASLLDLAQAERQYEETIAQIPSLLSDEASAVVGSTDELLDDAVSPDVESNNDSLVESVRKEIESIRSSLAGNATFNDSVIQSQVTRHSQRVSKMLEHDQTRLSQRWSQNFPTGTAVAMISTSIAESRTGSSSNHAELASSVLVSPSPSSLHDVSTMAPTAQDTHSIKTPLPALDPRAINHYASFLSSLLLLDLSERQTVLRALEQDVLAESHATTTLRETSHVQTSQEDLSISTNPHAESETLLEAQVYDNSQQLVDLVEEQILAWHKPKAAKASNSKNKLHNHGLTIDLRRQRINSLPHEIIDMMGHHVFRLNICWHLHRLDLSNNSLVTIPEVLVRLPHLEILNLRRNRLRRLPYSILKMSQLKSLSVEENYISAFPPVLGSMSNLILLYTSDNPVVYPSRDQIDYNFPTSEDSDESVASWTSQLKEFLQKQDILVWTLKLKQLMRSLCVEDPIDPASIAAHQVLDEQKSSPHKELEQPQGRDIPTVSVIEVNDDPLSESALSPLEPTLPIAWPVSSKPGKGLSVQSDDIESKPSASRPVSIMGQFPLSPSLVVSDHRRSRSQHQFGGVNAEVPFSIDDSRRRSHSVQEPSVSLDAKIFLKTETPVDVADASWKAHQDNNPLRYTHLAQGAPFLLALPNERSDGELLEPLSVSDTYSSLDAALEVSHDSGAKAEVEPHAESIQSPCITPSRTPEILLSRESSEQSLSLVPNSSSPTSPRLQTPTSPVSPGNLAGFTKKRTSYAHHRNTRVFDDLVFHMPEVEEDDRA
ncbi:hypothetical protein EKO04_000159 [Ascochyta lentis]|uniref:Uncharacterized protein n=1 Tax=Ascochyta lentis TaxID=205686 RepID=A0A8H7MNA4_9PLEO|nr:hypothetical protein EKO04_000159 [Ascochyta lentis]